MSYSHTQKRKTIARFKRTFKEKWYPEYRKHVEAIIAEMQGKPIGTLEDIMAIMGRRKP